MRISFSCPSRSFDTGTLRHAVVYKDGVPVPNCPSWASTGCVVFRTYGRPHGGWRITIRVDGSDPKGRI